MEKVNDGFRASVRLNNKNPEHQEIYQMFQSLIKSGRFANESEILRTGIKSLYESVYESEEKVAAVSEESIERIVSGVSAAVENLLSERILVQDSSEKAVAISDNQFLNRGASAPEETAVLPDGVCDFMSLMQGK